MNERLVFTSVSNDKEYKSSPTVIDQSVRSQDCFSKIIRDEIYFYSFPVLWVFPHLSS